MYGPQSLIDLTSIACPASGVLLHASPPKLFRNLVVSSEFTMKVNHWLIWSTTGLGVPAGTMAAHHPVKSIGTFCSVMVG